VAAILDFLLLLLVARALWRLGGGIVTGITQKPRQPEPPSPQGVQMVRDPVCGTFVLPDRALSVSVGRERVYFCSARCRDQYQARTA
jgi:hypothetical protein